MELNFKDMVVQIGVYNGNIFKITNESESV